MNKNTLTISQANSWQMFNTISRRYDFLNHLLSFGLDVHWRKRLIHFLPTQKNLDILDLATGTADVLITLAKDSNQIHSGYGLDLADKMLAIGQQKIQKANLSNKLRLAYGDAHHIPYESEKFDVVTMAFGIRNFGHPPTVLGEIHRVLKAVSRILILEFSIPQNQCVRFLYLLYLRVIVPMLGAIFSGHYHAYRYLNQTIEEFPYGEQFCDLLRTNGFVNVKANPLCFGIATIYQGEKK